MSLILRRNVLADIGTRQLKIKYQNG